MRPGLLLLLMLMLLLVAPPAICAAADNSRPPSDEKELRYWLESMMLHGFSPEEMRAATGLSLPDIAAALKRFEIDDASVRRRFATEGLLVLPYPGGRHPRSGFLEGAIDPQRETKVSVFAPWAEGGYAVVDVPEAIWWKEGESRELLYLAHTHVPTHWTKQDVALARLEWNRGDGGRLEIKRRLPNGVAFGAQVAPQRDHLAMELWLFNGTKETLTGLRVQNCVMLARLAGFAEDDGGEEDKVFASPFAARKSKDGRRWVITAWSDCQRTWANSRCPCLHADPQFPDCKPGETRRVRGGLWFYEGDDIRGELARLAAEFSGER